MREAMNQINVNAGPADLIPTIVPEDLDFEGFNMEVEAALRIERRYGWECEEEKDGSGVGESVRERRMAVEWVSVRERRMAVEWVRVGEGDGGDSEAGSQ